MGRWMREQDVRLLWRPGVCTVTNVPLGTGMVRFSPAALVVVNDVSSALCLGMVITGGNSLRVSLNTLSDGNARIRAPVSGQRHDEWDEAGKEGGRTPWSRRAWRTLRRRACGRH